MRSEPHLVTHVARIEGARNSMGELVVSWADPVTVRVYGWSPPAPDAETRSELTGVERDLDLYCRDAFAAPKDRVTVAGTMFVVVGHPEVFDFGPFGFTPGCRISLKRVEG